MEIIYGKLKYYISHFCVIDVSPMADTMLQIYVIVGGVCTRV